jgi:hypothetical protein
MTIPDIAAAQKVTDRFVSRTIPRHEIVDLTVGMKVYDLI